jgi:hypothetical protein
LALLVPGVAGAEDPDDALSADDLAVLAPPLDGRLDFHVSNPFAAALVLRTMETAAPRGSPGMEVRFTPFSRA